MGSLCYECVNVPLPEKCDEMNKTGTFGFPSQHSCARQGLAWHGKSMPVVVPQCTQELKLSIQAAKSCFEMQCMCVRISEIVPRIGV